MNKNDELPTGDSPESPDDPMEGLDPVARYALEHLGPGTLKGKLSWLRKAHKVLGEEPLVVLVPSKAGTKEGVKDNEGQNQLLYLLAEQIARDILRTSEKPPEAAEARGSPSDPLEPPEGHRKAEKKAGRGTPATSEPAPKIDGERQAAVSSVGDQGEVLP